MRETDPEDPSLALCQICVNRGDVTAYDKDMNGILRHYPTCIRYTFHNCNDFVPGNIEPGSSLRQIAEMMIKNAQYGRF